MAGEKYVMNKETDSHQFLSPSTAAGLHVTLKSTTELSPSLLQTGFKYVLMSHFSQIS